MNNPFFPDSLKRNFDKIIKLNSFFVIKKTCILIQKWFDLILLALADTDTYVVKEKYPHNGQ